MVCAVCLAARLSTPAPPEPLPHLYASANQLPQWNSSNVNDPWYAAKFKEKQAATTMEEVNSITKELNQYAIEQFWTLFSPIVPIYSAIQPWIVID